MSIKVIASLNLFLCYDYSVRGTSLTSLFMEKVYEVLVKNAAD